jgi:hypothetical protein
MEKKVNERNVNRNVFDDYQKKVFFDIEVGQFSRFVESPDFKLALQEMSVHVPSLVDLSPDFFSVNFNSSNGKDIFAETMRPDDEVEELEEKE